MSRAYPLAFKAIALWGLLLLTGCEKEVPDEAPDTPALYACMLSVPSDTYTFPIKPGTPEWAALPSGGAKVQACQLPASVLQKISTRGLAATCMDYPLLSSMLAYTSLQRGVRSQLENFNGFGELRQRSDAAVTLLDRYSRMQATCLPDSVRRGEYSLIFSYLEMILSQDEYLTRLSPSERHTLLREALTKYAHKKLRVGDVYGIFGLKTTAFLLARLMQTERYAPFVTAVSSDPLLKTFTTDVDLQGQPQTLDIIIEHATKFN